MTKALTSVRQWRILNPVMQFIETSVFTRQVTSLLEDEEYRQMQIALSARPDMGALIPGSGGLRKIRWSINGRGKRGGVRAIYYWVTKDDQILMLLLYPKNVQDDLSSQQLKVLREVVEKEFK
jgi:hypothetical protein